MFLFLTKLSLKKKEAFSLKATIQKISQLQIYSSSLFDLTFLGNFLQLEPLNLSNFNKMKRLLNYVNL